MSFDFSVVMVILLFGSLNLVMIDAVQPKMRYLRGWLVVFLLNIDYVFLVLLLDTFEQHPRICKNDALWILLYSFQSVLTSL